MVELRPPASRGQSDTLLQMGGNGDADRGRRPEGLGKVSFYDARKY